VTQFNASVAAARGQMRHASDLLQQADEKAKALGLSDSILNNLAGEALAKAMAGDRKGAVSEADAVLKQTQEPSIVLSLADVYARAGKDDQAEKLASRVATERPDDQFVQNVTVPMIRAVIAMDHHDAQKALSLMAPGQPYDRGNTESMYTRATALLMAGNADQAAQEFQRVLDLKYAYPSDLFVSYAQLGLARAYSGSDKSKSRAAYEDFLSSWKNADPNLPVLGQAKSEYATLQQ
jgi:eukaryotic-like serine/threonine-protein kinase